MKFDNVKVIKLVKSFMLILWPIISIFLIHFIQYQDFGTNLRWMWNSPGIIFLEYLLLAGLATVFIAIFNRVYVRIFCSNFLGNDSIYSFLLKIYE